MDQWRVLLARTGLTDRSAGHLCLLVESCAALSLLDISHNRFSEDGKADLLTAISESPFDCEVVVDLDSNSININNSGSITPGARSVRTGGGGGGGGGNATTGTQLSSSSVIMDRYSQNRSASGLAGGATTTAAVAKSRSHRTATTASAASPQLGTESVEFHSLPVTSRQVSGLSNHHRQQQQQQRQHRQPSLSLSGPDTPREKGGGRAAVAAPPALTLPSPPQQQQQQQNHPRVDGGGGLLPESSLPADVRLVRAPSTATATSATSRSAFHPGSVEALRRRRAELFGGGEAPLISNKNCSGGGGSPPVGAAAAASALEGMVVGGGGSGGGVQSPTPPSPVRQQQQQQLSPKKAEFVSAAGRSPFQTCDGAAVVDADGDGGRMPAMDAAAGARTRKNTKKEKESQKKREEIEIDEPSPASREPFERNDDLDLTANLNPVLDSVLDLSALTDGDGAGLKQPALFGGARSVWDIIDAYVTASEATSGRRNRHASGGGGGGSTPQQQHQHLMTPAALSPSVTAKLPSALIGGDSYNALTVLNISGNSLTELHTLPQSLLRLDVSSNSLTSLAGLHQCRMLTVLNARRNRIDQIATGLERNLCLAHLFLGRNRIKCVEGLAHLLILETLDLTHNKLKTQGSIRTLSLCASLGHLLLRGNPFADAIKGGNYRPLVRNLCPTLAVLDDTALAASRLGDALQQQSSFLRQPAMIDRARRRQGPTGSAEIMMDSTFGLSMPPPLSRSSHNTNHRNSSGGGDGGVSGNNNGSNNSAGLQTPYGDAESEEQQQSMNMLHMLTRGVMAPLAGYGDSGRAANTARAMANRETARKDAEEKKRERAATAEGKPIRAEVVKKLAAASKRYLEETIVERMTNLQQQQPQQSELETSPVVAPAAPASPPAYKPARFRPPVQDRRGSHSCSQSHRSASSPNNNDRESNTLNVPHRASVVTAAPGRSPEEDTTPTYTVSSYAAIFGADRSPLTQQQQQQKEEGRHADPEVVDCSPIRCFDDDARFMSAVTEDGHGATPTPTHTTPTPNNSHRRPLVRGAPHSKTVVPRQAHWQRYAMPVVPSSLPVRATATTAAAARSRSRSPTYQPAMPTHSIPPPPPQQQSHAPPVPPFVHTDDGQQQQQKQKQRVLSWVGELRRDTDSVQQALATIVQLIEAQNTQRGGGGISSSSSDGSLPFAATPESSLDLPQSFLQERRRCAEIVRSSGMLSDTQVPLDVVVYYGLSRGELESGESATTTGVYTAGGVGDRGRLHHNQAKEREEVLRLTRLLGDAKTCLRYLLVLLGDGRERLLQQYVAQVKDSLAVGDGT